MPYHQMKYRQNQIKLKRERETSSSKGKELQPMSQNILSSANNRSKETNEHATYASETVGEVG